MRYLDSGWNSLGVGSSCPPHVCNEGAGWILSELSSKWTVLNLEHGRWRQSVNLKHQVCPGVKQDQTRLRAAKSPQVSAEPLWMQLCFCRVWLGVCVTSTNLEFNLQVLAGSPLGSFGQGKQAPSPSLPFTMTCSQNRFWRVRRRARVVTPSACHE